MPPNLPGLFDTVWLVSAALLWTVGVVLISIWRVRLRFPARRPETYGRKSPVPGLIVLGAGIGSLLAVKWHFGLAGLVLAAGCLGLVAVATVVAGTLSTARSYKAMMRAYEYCILKGMSRNEALSDISSSRCAATACSNRLAGDPASPAR